MDVSAPGPHLVRFGVFEFELRSGELRKAGLRLKLPDQPLQFLTALVQRPGEVVTRDELRRRLWADDTFVDFEHGLNAAVKRLRDTLGDSADTPRFIETVPRRGYRFIAPVERLDPLGSRPVAADNRAFAFEAVTLPTATGATAAVDVPGVRPGRLPMLLTILLTLVAIALAAGWYANQPGVDRGAPRFTPFATDAAEKSDARWSPDGRSIAYAMIVNRRSQIFVRSLDSDSPVRITFGSEDANRPFWWPDASRLGFQSGGEVWSVSAAGGAPEVVQKGRIGAAGLSPDGQVLATWRIDKTLQTSSLWLASPPAAVPREYTPAPFRIKGQFGPTFVQFSPDGRQLLLAGWDDAGDSSIWVLPFPDGGRPPHRLFPKIPGIRAQMPTQSSWMPDSQRAVMVFRTAAAPNGGLWMVDVRTGAATPVATGVTQFDSPSVSPDGSRVVVSAGSTDFDLVDVPLDGSPVRDLLATGSREYSGARVPRSSRYVYLTNKNGEEELRIHSQTENSDNLIVASRTFGGTAEMSSPAPSPDGRQVVYDVWGSAGSNVASSIWVSPVVGGAPIKLTPEGATENGPEWSPDGQQIVCHHVERGGEGIAIIRVGASDPPRLLVQAIADVIPAWSPDSAWIAYRTADSLWLVRPDGSGQRLLSTGRGGALVWSRDSRFLYSARRDDGALQVIAIDVATGAVRVVGTVSPGLYFAAPSEPGLRFTMAEDGNSFLATIMRSRTDLWILEDFAPRGGVLDWFRRRRSQ